VRRLTAEVREERRRRDRDRLEQATRELLSSEGWKRWLRARATFHSYTFLIWRARPRRQGIRRRPSTTCHQRWRALEVE
jgi:hypothetical protein